MTTPPNPSPIVSSSFTLAPDPAPSPVPTPSQPVGGGSLTAAAQGTSVTNLDVVLPTPAVSSSDVLFEVLQAIGNHNSELATIGYDNPQALNGIQLGNALDAAGLTAILTTLSQEVNTDADDVSGSSSTTSGLNLSQLITDYDNGLGDDSTEAGDINNAIENYDSAFAIYLADPTSGAALANYEAQTSILQGAISTWNAYASERNTNDIGPLNSAINTYNSTIGDYNQGATALNALGSAASLNSSTTVLSPPNNTTNTTVTINLPLPIATAVSVNSVPVLPTLPPLTLNDFYTNFVSGVPGTSVSQPTVTPPIALPADAIYQVFYDNIADAIIHDANDLDKILIAIKSQQDFQTYYINFLGFRGGRPASYVDPKGKTNSSGGSGSGFVSIGASPMQTSHSYHSLRRSMARSTTRSDERTVSNPNTNAVTNPLTLFGFNTLKSSAASSVLPAAALLGEKFGLVSPGGVAMNAAQSSAFLHNIIGHTTSGTLTGNLAVALQTPSGGVTPDQASRLATTLTPGLNVSLVGYGLFGLATSLALPGLTPQLAANVAGLSPIDAIAAFSGGVGIPPNLNNSASLAGNTIADRLNFSAPVASSIITNGVNTVGPNAPPATLRTALTQGFIGAGLSPINARTAANIGLSYTLGDVGQPLLDNTLPQSNINLELARPTLTGTLNQLGYPVAAASGIVGTTLATVQANQYTTPRALRDSATTSFQNQGVSRNDSITASNQLSSVVQNQAYGTSLQEYGVSQGNIDTNVLNQSVSYHLQQNGIANSDTLASQATASTVQGQYATHNQLRVSLAQNLINTGAVQPSVASRTAAAAVIIPPLPQGVSPLQSPYLNTILTPPQIATELNTNVLTTLTPHVGHAKAQEISNNIVTQTVGPADQDRPNNSALQVLNTSTAQANQQGDQQFAQNTAQSFNDAYVRPTTDSFQINQSIQSPANLVLSSTAVSVNGQQRAPQAGSGQARDVVPLTVPV